METREIILAIQEIIKKHGSLNADQLGNAPLPALLCLGRTELLLDTFNEISVTVVTYVDGVSHDENEVMYEDLNPNTVYDIYNILENYDWEMAKTWQRGENLNS